MHGWDHLHVYEVVWFRENISAGFWENAQKSAGILCAEWRMAKPSESGLMGKKIGFG